MFLFLVEETHRPQAAVSQLGFTAVKMSRHGADSYSEFSLQTQFLIIIYETAKGNDKRENKETDWISA